MHNTTHAPTIRCWTTSLLLVTVTVVAAVGASGRGYAVEARTWAGAIVAAVSIPQRRSGLRAPHRTPAGPLAEVDRARPGWCAVSAAELRLELSATKARAEREHHLRTSLERRFDHRLESGRPGIRALRALLPERTNDAGRQLHDAVDVVALWGQALEGEVLELRRQRELVRAAAMEALGVDHAAWESALAALADGQTEMIMQLLNRAVRQ